MRIARLNTHVCVLCASTQVALVTGRDGAFISDQFTDWSFCNRVLAQLASVTAALARGEVGNAELVDKIHQQVSDLTIKSVDLPNFATLVT